MEGLAAGMGSRWFEGSHFFRKNISLLSPLTFRGGDESGWLAITG